MASKTVSLCFTLYDRPELTAKTLQASIVDYPSGADQIFFLLDGPKDEETLNVARKVIDRLPSLGIPFEACTQPNQGIAKATNESFEKASG